MDVLITAIFPPHWNDSYDLTFVEQSYSHNASSAPSEQSSIPSHSADLGIH